jgi:endonuclease/exonuclease/phosphatase family metal-dependent hydrolase
MNSNEFQSAKRGCSTQDQKVPLVKCLIKPRSTALAFSAAFALLLLLTSAPIEVTPVAPRKTDSLRVITYNTQLLPLEILNKQANSPYRAKQQATYLAQYDIVGLNEVFRTARRTDLLNTFRELWGADFHVVTPTESDQSSFGLDSGLILLSRYPITESHTLTFGNDSKLRDRGLIADGYAKKGALHARVQYTSPDRTSIQIDCFVTHLESVDYALRSEQVAMLTQFVKQHAASKNPILLLGDFNIAGDAADLKSVDSQYALLRKNLNTVRNDWTDLGQTIDPKKWGTSDSSDPTGGLRIDYVFLANPSRGPILISRKASVQRFANPYVAYLSDHSAVEAEFHIQD